MRILAIDPGGTTGWALWDDDSRAVTYGHVVGWENAVDSIVDACSEPTQLVCESYAITAQTLKLARCYDSLYIIGCLYHLAHTDPNISLYMQTPSQAKSFGTNTKLERLGGGVKNGHAVDAARHLLVWLFENGRIEAKELSGDS